MLLLFLKTLVVLETIFLFLIVLELNHQIIIQCTLWQSATNLRFSKLLHLFSFLLSLKGLFTFDIARRSWLWHIKNLKRLCLWLMLALTEVHKEFSWVKLVVFFTTLPSSLNRILSLQNIKLLLITLVGYFTWCISTCRSFLLLFEIKVEMGHIISVLRSYKFCWSLIIFSSIIWISTCWIQRTSWHTPIRNLTLIHHIFPAWGPSIFCLSNELLSVVLLEALNGSKFTLLLWFDIT